MPLSRNDQTQLCIFMDWNKILYFFYKYLFIRNWVEVTGGVEAFLRGNKDYKANYTDIYLIKFVKFVRPNAALSLIIIWKPLTNVWSLD